MIDLYTRDEIPWQQCTGKRDDGMALYAPQTVITGFFEYQRKLIRNAQGEQTVSEALLMTKTPVNAGDLLTWDGRDWLVHIAKPIKNFVGKVLFYEARL